MHHAKFSSMRDSIVTATSCEIRAALYAALAESIGSERAMACFLYAESEAVKAMKQLKYSDLQ